jgi:hypothetical protein
MVETPPHPLASICRPWRAGGSGTARPLWSGIPPHRGAEVPDQRCIAPSCRGEALPRPPGGTPGNPTRPLTATHLCGRSPVCDPGHRESRLRTPSTGDGVMAGPVGRRVRQRLTPTKWGIPPHRGGRVPHRRSPPHLWGGEATPRLARRRLGMARGRCPTPVGRRPRWPDRRPENLPGVQPRRTPRLIRAIPPPGNPPSMTCRAGPSVTILNYLSRHVRP